MIGNNPSQPSGPVAPEPTCNEVVCHLIAGASWFLCALPKGHDGGHRALGNCFKHGPYYGEQGIPPRCPGWPECALQQAMTPQVVGPTGGETPEPLRQKAKYYANCIAGETKPSRLIESLHAAFVDVAHSERELLESQLALLESERDKIMRALEGLTPSGSEFVNNVERCVAFVRDTRDSQMKAMLRFKRRAEKAEAGLDELLGRLSRQALVIQQRQDSWREMQAERDGLRSALVKYGSHILGCSYNRTVRNDMNQWVKMDCTCGWDEHRRAALSSSPSPRKNDRHKCVEHINVGPMDGCDKCRISNVLNRQDGMPEWVASSPSAADVPSRNEDYKAAKGCAPSLNGVSPEEAIRRVRGADVPSKENEHGI